jgi:hypothetical protein
MGSERYAHLVGTADGIHAALFTRDRFFDQKDGDTFYNIWEEPYYTTAQSYFDEAKWFGDKLPLLYTQLDHLAERIPQAKLIVLVRNIYDVAASYEARRTNHLDLTWEGGGVAQAVQDWNQLFESLEKAPKGFEVLTVTYKSLFLERQGPEALLRFLGIKNTTAVRAAYLRACADAQKLEHERAKAHRLSASDISIIRRTANFEGYRRVLSACHLSATR